MQKKFVSPNFALLIGGSVSAAKANSALNKGDTIVILGSGMASRMNHFGHFETELQLRFPKLELTIRNIGDGETPAFRPHPGRNLLSSLHSLKQSHMSKLSIV